MIRHDYPNIHKWLLHIYYDESPEETRGAFYKTTHFRDVSLPFKLPVKPFEELFADTVRTQIKGGYAKASRVDIVPLGPVPDVMPRGSV